MQFRWNTQGNHYNVTDLAIDTATCVRKGYLKSGASPQEIIECLRDHNACDKALAVCEESLALYTILKFMGLFKC